MASGNWGCVTVIGLALVIGYCSSGRHQPTPARSEETTSAASEPTADGTARDPALDAMAPISGETYAEYDARRNALGGSAGSYEGDECTVDCGGHEAGRAWAERRGITDENECGGRSWSFREGCATYARKQSGEAARADEASVAADKATDSADDE